MLNLQSTVKNSRDEILRLAAQHGAEHVRLFGSVVRGKQTSESDLDLLVKLAPGRSLLDLVALKQDLEETLACRVDVVTEASLSPYLREKIVKEAIPL